MIVKNVTLHQTDDKYVREGPLTSALDLEQRGKLDLIIYFIKTLVFFPIRPPQGLLPVLGPLERYYDAYT